MNSPFSAKTKGRILLPISPLLQGSADQTLWKLMQIVFIPLSSMKLDKFILTEKLILTYYCSRVLLYKGI